jgi:hypothetical protein
VRFMGGLVRKCVSPDMLVIVAKVAIQSSCRAR